jgi:hypothetical protein
MLERLTGKPIDQIVTDVARHLAAQKTPEGDHGLGIYDWGQGRVGHTGQIIGWESLVAYTTRTGAAFVAIVNETGPFMSARSVGLEVFPDLKGLLER